MRWFINRKQMIAEECEVKLFLDLRKANWALFRPGLWRHSSWTLSSECCAHYRHSIENWLMPGKAPSGGLYMTPQVYLRKERKERRKKKKRGRDTRQLAAFWVLPNLSATEEFVSEGYPASQKSHETLSFSDIAEFCQALFVTDCCWNKPGFWVHFSTQWNTKRSTCDLNILEQPIFVANAYTF